MPSMHEPYGYSRALNQHPPYASMSMYNGSQAAPNQLAFGFQPPLGAMAPPSHGAGYGSMSGFNSMPSFGGIPSFNSIPSFNPMPSAPPSQAYGFQPYAQRLPGGAGQGYRKTIPCRDFANGRCKRGTGCAYGHFMAQAAPPPAPVQGQKKWISTQARPSNT